MEERIEKIKAAQAAQGLSAQQLAEISTVSKSTVYRILRGETSPDSVTLDLLEEALGLTVPPATGLDAHALACRTCRQSYNRQLAEKERWIKREFIVCLILVAFVCLILIADIAIPTAGWVQH